MLNRNFISVIDGRTSFVGKGCISWRLVGTAPRLQREIDKKEKEEGKRARKQEGKRARKQEGERARGQEGKRARGQEGKRARVGQRARGQDVKM